MTAERPLAGQRVLVTRPRHQAADQAEELRRLGAEPVLLPLLEIEPIPQDDPAFAAARRCVLDLDLYHAVIFVSANAARFGAELIDDYWPQLPVGVHWLAIGAKTAATLDAHGIRAYHSTEGYDSEALLRAEPLQQVADKRILILRGDSGRDTLASELRSRGARVDYASLYRRGAPTPDPAHLESTIYARALSAILITSGESLTNLVRLATTGTTLNTGLARLQQCPWWYRAGA
ncbi:uroporphyrinogen-III synthase [Marinobacterium aestuariivivens]|uniref:Uroporphyrinogen-III synthase n=1 Tax=Marinobacterium aestuariivivens TaxID=1698799 RepID=A0ABW2A090_9GAMM